MKIKSLSLKNWKNFRRLDDVQFTDKSYIIGANATGKSNLLDALKFLRDVALPAGPRPSSGGFQEAVNSRGGLKKLRCLNAKRDPEVMVSVVVEEITSSGNNEWLYELGFKGEGKGNNRFEVSREIVKCNDKIILERPDKRDIADSELLTRTHLEQTGSNFDFRDLAHFFSSITYLHLVPQLLKFADEIGGNRIQKDPFGQGFLRRIADTRPSTRESRLKRISKALEKVVPQFQDLQFDKDNMGHPFLKANFKHWRDNGAWQQENQFSDGTLRLIGLLWSLMEGDSLLLLEEPELSLNEEIVRKIPNIIHQILKSGKATTRQVILTTHSDALLADQSIGAESVIRLKSTEDGTVVSAPTEEEKIMLKSGMTVGETLLPAVKPDGLDGLNFN